MANELKRDRGSQLNDVPKQSLRAKGGGASRRAEHIKGARSAKDGAVSSPGKEWCWWRRQFTILGNGERQRQA